MSNFRPSPTSSTKCLIAPCPRRILSRYRKRCRDRLVSTLQSFLDSATIPNIWVGCTKSAHRARFDEYGQLVNLNQTGASPRWLRDMFSQHIKKLQETSTDPLLQPSGIRGEYFSTLNAHGFLLDAALFEGENFCVELESKVTQALDEWVSGWFSMDGFRSSSSPRAFRPLAREPEVNTDRTVMEEVSTVESKVERYRMSYFVTRDPCREI
ncbi:hypothetical protein EDB84DRAFT_1446909 [Lactarius hengduanensis]|nr:hypothetical protein EDB84DRAFT_1446909 [Lactarius hengduanensis]